MASETFTVAGKRVTVRTRKPPAETGLRRVTAADPGLNVSVTVDGIAHADVGGISASFAIYIASVDGLWNVYNSLNKEDAAPHKPFRYKTQEAAFNALVRYVKCQLEQKPFTP